MKRTKNMYYKETTESIELLLYIENNYKSYMCLKHTLKMLYKHVKRNEYNKDKAIDAYYNVATIASKEYMKEFCDSRTENIFTVTDRFTVAIDLESLYHDIVFNNAF